MKMERKKNRIIARTKKPSEKKQKHDTNLESYRCPKCKHIITIENKFTQDMFFHCPNCGQKNIFNLPPEQSGKEYKKSHKNARWPFQINFNAMIIGTILTLTSLAISLLFKQNPFTTKLSITLLIIGIIFPLFIIEKKQNLSMKITFGTILYIILLFSITGTDLEIFLILIFLGVLVTKTVIDEYLPTSLKTRMNLVILVFLVIFIIIVTKRIINLVGI